MQVDYYDYSDQSELSWFFCSRAATVSFPFYSFDSIIIVNPSFPTFYCKSDKPDDITISEVAVLVNDEWKVGDLVDWWTGGCYWSATTLTKILSVKKLQVWLVFWLVMFLWYVLFGVNMTSWHVAKRYELDAIHIQAIRTAEIVRYLVQESYFYPVRLGHSVWMFIPFSFMGSLQFHSFFLSWTLASSFLKEQDTVLQNAGILRVMKCLANHMSSGKGKPSCISQMLWFCVVYADHLMQTVKVAKLLGARHHNNMFIILDLNR